MNFSYQPRAFSFKRAVHDKLPPFKYHPLATDRLTQLFATWQWAASHIDWNTPWIPAEDGAKLEKCYNQVYEFHRRRFLKAFAKKHPLPRQKGSHWECGSAQDILHNLDHRGFARAFAHQYKQARFWRQHVPKLP